MVVAVLLLCVAGIVCLTPLAFYLRWLATINRRERVTVIAAPWDFVALLAGLSGFLLFGGGVLVSALQSGARLIFRGNLIRFDEVAQADWVAWVTAAGIYFCAVVVVVARTLIVRSDALSVYNLDRTQAAEVVEAVLSHLGISAKRSGELWSDGSGEVLEMQPFDGFRHVTIRLLTADPRRRQEIERSLRTRLATITAGGNPVAPYLHSAATIVGCSAATFVATIGYLLYVFTTSR